MYELKMENNTHDANEWPATNPFKNAILNNNATSHRKSTNPFLNNKESEINDDDENIALGKLYPAGNNEDDVYYNPPFLEDLIERYKLNPQVGSLISFNEEDLITLSKIDDSLTIHLNYESLNSLKSSDKDRFTNPLEPPPPQFSRPARVSTTYPPMSFSPTCIYTSKKNNLHSGFPPLYPTCLDSHNISSDDWKRFIQDICLIDYKGFNSLPKTTLQKYLFHTKRNKHSTFEHVETAIHLWNKNFFIPRKVLIWFQQEHGRLLILSLS